MCFRMVLLERSVEDDTKGTEMPTILQVYIGVSARILHIETVDHHSLLHSPHLEFGPKIDF